MGTSRRLLAYLALKAIASVAFESGYNSGRSDVVQRLGTVPVPGTNFLPDRTYLVYSCCGRWTETSLQDQHERKTIDVHTAGNVVGASNGFTRESLSAVDGVARKACSFEYK